MVQQKASLELTIKTGNSGRGTRGIHFRIQPQRLCVLLRMRAKRRGRYKHMLRQNHRLGRRRLNC